MTARFITLEGGEGTGKSTQARRLAATLEAKGKPCIVTREPGGSPGAEEIRRLLVQGERERWDVLAETLLIFAARTDHVRHTIKPALDAGKWVICDRFIDSTYAYQGAGRGLDREIIRRIESAAIGDFRPQLTLILDVSPDIGLMRTATRATPLFDPAMKDPEEAETALRRRKEARFEQFGKNFHERLRKSFKDAANREPTRCVLIDASGTPDEVERVIWDIAQSRLSIADAGSVEK